MKDKKKIKILWKVMKRICDQNPEMQEVIDVLMVQVCTEEGISAEHVFFILLLFAMGKKCKQECLKLNFLCEKKARYGNSRGFWSRCLFLRLEF